MPLPTGCRAGLGLKGHAVLHLAVLGISFAFLPVSLPANATPPDSSFPAFWLLAVLTGMIGLPFFVVSCSGPLLQRWYAATGQPGARDPYFLYAASNLGSMLALLAYPALVEPWTSLPEQAWLWSGGYGVFGVLTLACAVVLWRSPVAVPDARVETPVAPLGTWRCLRWVLLAFAPSSLMLSVTTYLTTDLAAMPLLWVITLGLYLLSFTLVFARRPLLPHKLLVRGMPLFVILLMIALLSEATEPLWLLLILHLAGLFVIAMVCHGELARDRPDSNSLDRVLSVLVAGRRPGGLVHGAGGAALVQGPGRVSADLDPGVAAAALLCPGGVGQPPVMVYQDLRPTIHHRAARCAIPRWPWACSRLAWCSLQRG